MRQMSAAQIIHSKNVLNSFNKRSDRFKETCVNDGMKIHEEWEENGFRCFYASASQEQCKAGNTVYSHVAANINAGYGRIEYDINGGYGRIHSICIHPEK